MPTCQTASDATSYTHLSTVRISVDGTRYFRKSWIGERAAQAVVMIQATGSSAACSISPATCRMPSPG